MSAQSETAITGSVSRSLRKSVRSFVMAHGGKATMVAQPVGRQGVRVTLVGADGVFGDRMVADERVVGALVKSVAGLSRSEGWDRETSARARPRDGHWRKMAGWVASQHMFPKARNE